MVGRTWRDDIADILAKFNGTVSSSLRTIIKGGTDAGEMKVNADGSVNEVLHDSSGVEKGTNSNPVVTNPQPFSKDTDSIDVAKMTKGGIVVAHNAITTTAQSVEINCSGFNSMRVHVTVSGSGTVDVSAQTAPVSGGTYVDSYNENGVTQQKVSAIATPGKSFTIAGIGDYVKITATITGTATVTVNVLPFNI